jgi:hypothetical protein
VQDTLERNLLAIGCDSENAEMQWNNIKECVLDNPNDLVVKVEKREENHGLHRKRSVKWKNVYKEGRKHYRRQRNELRRDTDNAKKRIS